MYDYARVQLMGRATGDAKFYNLDDPDRTSRAIFTIACNIGYRKSNDIEVRSIFRKVVALGSFANYIARCQDEGGFRGRLINILGTLDNEINREPGVDESEQREIILVAQSADGFIKIMDRPHDYDN
jgi:hypothetical protein